MALLAIKHQPSKGNAFRCGKYAWQSLLRAYLFSYPVLAEPDSSRLSAGWADKGSERMALSLGSIELRAILATPRTWLGQRSQVVADTGTTLRPNGSWPVGHRQQRLPGQRHAVSRKTKGTQLISGFEVQRKYTMFRTYSQLAGKLVSVHFILALKVGKR